MERARTVANPTLMRELKNGGHATEQTIFDTEQSVHILLRKPLGKIAFLELMQHVCNTSQPISASSQELLVNHNLLDQQKNPRQEQRDILLSMIKVRNKELLLQGATKL
jgi:hypothetical protein